PYRSQLFDDITTITHHIADILILSNHRDHPDLPSFPTRRSSDLDHPRSRWQAGGNGRADPRHRVAEPRQRGGPLRRHPHDARRRDRKSTRLNSSHVAISYAVFCLKKKIRQNTFYYKLQRCYIRV